MPVRRLRPGHLHHPGPHRLPCPWPIVGCPSSRLRSAAAQSLSVPTPTRHQSQSCHLSHGQGLSTARLPVAEATAGFRSARSTSACLCVASRDFKHPSSSHLASIQLLSSSDRHLHGHSSNVHQWWHSRGDLSMSRSRRLPSLVADPLVLGHQDFVHLVAWLELTFKDVFQVRFSFPWWFSAPFTLAVMFAFLSS